MKALLLILGLALISGSAVVRAAPDDRTKAEITHLFSFLRTSKCEFFRNGSWYAAPRAADHLQRKYEYLLKRDQVATAESFIALAATESSSSGKPYQVRCGSAPAIASGKWFAEVLTRYRAATH